MVNAAAALVLVLLLGGLQAEAGVPLPQPRPTEASKAAPQSADKAEQDRKNEAEQQAEKQAKGAPQPPSVCRLGLTDEIAIAPSIPAIEGPGACGGEDLVRLDAVVLPDKRRVPLKPAGIMRCTMASAVANWVRTDMAQLAGTLGTQLAELDNFDSFDCRGRNRVAGAKLSEHGKANALDLRGLKFTNGVTLSLTDPAASREAREQVLQSVCTRFTTVLGPGSDGYHEDHIHIDLAERRSGYRICQWNLYEPLPQIAPLLPAERPEDAPPREVAEAKADTKPDAKPDTPAQQTSPSVPLPAARPPLRGMQDDAVVATRPAPETMKPPESRPEAVPLPTPSPLRTAQRSDTQQASEAAPPPKRKVKRRRVRSPFDDWFRNF